MSMARIFLASRCIDGQFSTKRRLSRVRDRPFWTRRWPPMRSPKSKHARMDGCRSLDANVALIADLVQDSKRARQVELSVPRICIL